MARRDRQNVPLKQLVLPATPPPQKKKNLPLPKKRKETLASALNAPSLSASRSRSHLFPSLRCAAGRDESERLNGSFGVGWGYALGELCEGDARGVKVPFQSEESKGNKRPQTASNALNNIDRAACFQSIQQGSKKYINIKD